MYSTITSGAVHGIDSYLVSVEVNIANGLPVIDMVGSLSGEVKEARERVRVALHNSGFPFPASRITVNLSPANIRKEGSAFDLPIAVGILKSMERVQICEEMQNALFLGELGLNGEVRFSRGVLPIVLEARKKGIRHCFVPYVNQGEAEVAEGICVHGVRNLRQVLDILEGRSGQTFEERIKYGKKGEKREKRKEGEEGTEGVQGEARDHEEWEEGREESTGVNGQIKRKQREAGYGREMQPVGEINNKRGKANEELDFAQIRGQEILKKAAMISAAGFHHVLIVGPPGVGKTMIAKRMPTILPPMSLEECLEVTKIYSVSGMIHEECPLIRTRPFMSPHHTISKQALAGGGRIPKPGVISLAHKGVLFLDELPEFKRDTLDVMRQPLEEKKVQISRNLGTYDYPADFILFAALNPCPCGYFPNRKKCSCTPAQIKNYISHVSGPLMDRIDLCVQAEPFDIRQTKRKGREISSEDMRRRVMTARRRQTERFCKTSYEFNSQLDTKAVEEYCRLDSEVQQQFERLVSEKQLSARAYYRTLKVARTIADLENQDTIGMGHLLEALCYRDEKWLG